RADVLLPRLCGARPGARRGDDRGHADHQPEGACPDAVVVVLPDCRREGPDQGGGQGEPGEVARAPLSDAVPRDGGAAASVLRRRQQEDVRGAGPLDRLARSDLASAVGETFLLAWG